MTYRIRKLSVEENNGFQYHLEVEIAIITTLFNEHNSV